MTLQSRLVGLGRRRKQFNLKANGAAQPVVGEAVRNETDIAYAGHTIIQLFYSSPLANLYLN
jgi:hypothetical protein